MDQCFSESEVTQLSYLNDALIAAPQLSGELTGRILRGNGSSELRETVTALAVALEEESQRVAGAWDFGRLLRVAEKLCAENQPRHIRAAGDHFRHMVEDRMPQPIPKPIVIHTAGENPAAAGLRAAAAIARRW